MDLRNLSCLIIASGHDWKWEMNRQKPERLVSQCLQSGVTLYYVLHDEASIVDLYVFCNAFWTAFLFL